MEDTYIVAAICADGEMYMTDASMIDFSNSVYTAKKFTSEESAKKYMDDHFISLSYWIGRNTNRRINGVFICSTSRKDVVTGRLRYL